MRLSRDPRLGSLQRQILLSAVPKQFRHDDLMGVEAIPVPSNPLSKDAVPYAPPLPKPKR